MKQAASPLSRKQNITRLPDKGIDYDIKANEEEKANLAKLLNLESIASLKASLNINGTPNRIRVKGSLIANLTQTCVISLEPFETEINQPIDLFFSDDVIMQEDLDPESDIPDPIIDGIIDLGAIVAEHLALSLDPYPKKPDASFTFKPEPESSIMSHKLLEAEKRSTLKKPKP